MQHTIEKGLILQDEASINSDKICDNICSNYKQADPIWQVRRIAKRHCLTQSMAKLVCGLQNYGGTANG